jgi:5'-3' exonuclease
MEDIDDLKALAKGKSFASMSSKDPEIVMVVDAINLGFRFLHAGQLDFADEYVKTVQSLAQSYKAGRIIIACDKGASSYRKHIYPEYKANRKEKQALQTPEEKAKFEAFFQEFERTLGLLEELYVVLRYEGVEADDIGAYLVSALSYKHLWLISTDKDWDLLVSDKVSRFSYVTRKEVTIDNWPYECTMDNYLGLKVLSGDAGDNITKPEGLGPKRSLALLEEYGDIFGVIEAIPLPGKQKFIQSLNASKELLYRNIELMDLATFCREAIGEDNLKDINERLN